jgi:hypothetical protein
MIAFWVDDPRRFCTALVTFGRGSRLWVGLQVARQALVTTAVIVSSEEGGFGSVVQNVLSCRAVLPETLPSLSDGSLIASRRSHFKPASWAKVDFAGWLSQRGKGSRMSALAEGPSDKRRSGDSRLMHDPRHPLDTNRSGHS